jgi:hypothetical protein
MHDILLNHLPFANHLAGGHQGIRAWASLAGGASGRPVALVAPALSSSVRQAMVSTFKAAGDGWQIISGRSNDRLHLCATCCRTLWATLPSLAAYGPHRRLWQHVCCQISLMAGLRWLRRWRAVLGAAALYRRGLMLPHPAHHSRLQV